MRDDPRQAVRGAARAALFVVAAVLSAQSIAAECVAPGTWAAPRLPQPAVLASKQVLEQAASRPVVLIGELHERAEHHRLELHTSAALHAIRSNVVLGFEMFPRRVQPILDRWVAGELTEAQFLQQVNWPQVWGYEAALYLPLFHFARMHRIPMVALNIERSLVRDVSSKGYDGVPESAREGVGRPAAPPPGYVQRLHSVFIEHGEERKAAKIDDPAFLRFIESQTLWDRAMAEGISAALRRHPGRQVIAMMGQGHTQPGAVPHQLRALGIDDAMVLMAWERDADCSRLEPGLADAVFGVEAAAKFASAAPRPRLGVVLNAAQGGGVRIDQVTAASVAEQAGIKAGDVVLMVAGRKVAATGDVVNAVGRQAPGTWLPLRVRRDGTEIDIVARFPPDAN